MLSLSNSSLQSDNDIREYKEKHLKCPDHGLACGHIGRDPLSEPFFKCSNYECKKVTFRNWKQFLRVANLHPNTLSYNFMNSSNERERAKQYDKRVSPDTYALLLTNQGSRSSNKRKSGSGSSSRSVVSSSPSKKNRPQPTVVDLLKQFLKTTRIEYNCEKCESKFVDKSQAIVKFPRILALQIKRFRPSADLTRYEKITDPVTINPVVDLVDLERVFPVVVDLPDSPLRPNKAFVSPSSSSSPTKKMTQRTLGFVATNTTSSLTNLVPEAPSAPTDEESLEAEINKVEKKLERLRKLMVDFSPGNKQLIKFREREKELEAQLSLLFARVSGEGNGFVVLADDAPLSITSSVSKTPSPSRNSGDGRDDVKKAKTEEEERQSLDHLLEEQSTLAAELDAERKKSFPRKDVIEALEMKLALNESAITASFEAPSASFTSSRDEDGVAKKEKDSRGSGGEEKRDGEKTEEPNMDTDAIVLDEDGDDDRTAKSDDSTTDDDSPSIPSERKKRRRGSSGKNNVDEDGIANKEEVSESEEENNAHSLSPVALMPRLDPDPVRVASEYILHCSLQHLGNSAYSGHYVSSIRQSHAISNSDWDVFDDSRVRRVSREEALNKKAQQSAYILFYVRQDVSDTWHKKDSNKAVKK